MTPREVAEQIVQQSIDAECTSGDSDPDSLIDQITEALLAERARCLAIVRDQPNYPDTHTGTRQQWVRGEILRKISEG